MRILYITTVGTTMIFFKSIVKELIREGHIVDIATNENNGETPVDAGYKRLGCKIFHISCRRSPFNEGNIKTILEIRKLLSGRYYDIVHCHTPIVSVCTRIACRKLRKSGTIKVIYTAHGFHFYSGAPLRNWLIYYPIELLCSYWTDVLITINEEDYKRAKKRFHAKRTEYVPGVGIDTEKFRNGVITDRTVESFRRIKIREEFGVPKDAILLLSVGELNDNKNHEVVLRAIENLDVYYIIVGCGKKKECLKEMVIKHNLTERVKFTGYRKDVVDFYVAADIYILPSKREGLNVSIMEAMASGLPVACSRIRGNTELVDANGGCLFDPYSSKDVARSLIQLISIKYEMCGIYNLDKIRKFDISLINRAIKSFYEGGWLENQFKNLQNIILRNTIRNSLCIPYDAIVMTSVGEINKNKNHSIVIKALSILSDIKCPQLHYVIAGKGGLESKLRILTQKLGIADRVHFIGYRKDIPQIYAASDICVFPSIREGQGIALIEGMASGLPAVVSDNRGTRGFISENNAFICRYNDVHGFANAIRELYMYSAIRRNMGMNNLRDSCKFDVSVINRKMKQIYGGDK